MFTHLSQDNLEIQILLGQIRISQFDLVEIGILICTGLKPMQIRIQFLLGQIGIPICPRRILDCH